MRKLIGIILCSIGPLWVVVLFLHERLMTAGLLNKKDLPPFVGSEKGTFSEYLLNVWHWDGLLLLLLVAALPCLILGVWLLRSSRFHQHNEHTI
jgi:hypothetical protein